MDDIGPQLPPHLLAKRKRQQEEMQEEEAKKVAEKEQNPVTSRDEDDKDIGNGTRVEKRRRTMGPIGPAMPSAPLNERPSEPANTDDDVSNSSDDDGIGPALPGSEKDVESSRRLLESRHSQAEDKSKPKRDDWMMVPPEQGDWTQRVDPTKIKSRKFQSGVGARAPIAKGGDGSLWTESPIEKAKRLNDEVMGIKRPATQGENTGEDHKSRKEKHEATETKKRIDDYNTKYRSKTLFDAHQTSKDRKEDDDPSKRPFDREKDIVGSSKNISHKQRGDMMKRASDMGSRFSSGSYL